MVETADRSEKSHWTFPALSILALVCPAVLLAIVLFLSTQQGRNFNEWLFGRLYTLGAILMLGFYGAISLCLLGSGFVLGITACIRREAPLWFPYLALATNVIVPIAIMRFLK